MGFKYIVKSFVWQTTGLKTTLTEFSDEHSALEYARELRIAETIKIYVNDEVTHIINAESVVEPYA
jgi:hypothetical protein